MPLGQGGQLCRRWRKIGRGAGTGRREKNNWKAESGEGVKDESDCQSMTCGEGQDLRLAGGRHGPLWTLVARPVM